MWSGPLSFSQNTCFVCEIARILGSRLELTSVGMYICVIAGILPTMLSSLRSNCPSKYLGVLELFELRIVYTSNRVLLNFQTCAI